MSRPTPATTAPRRLLDKLLLHGQVTRRQIGEGFGISLVAASKHVDWLKRHRLADSRTVRVPSVKRPVEVLSVNDRLAAALAVQLRADVVAAELVGASGQALDAATFAIPTAEQSAVLDAVRAAVAWARQRLRAARRTLGLAGLSVTGYLEPTSGMIFRVAGVADWEPCHLGDVAPDLAGVPVLPWTSVSCRLRGLSKHLGVDHRVGYIAYDDGRLAVATLEHGSIALGRFGTGGGAVHQQVSDAPHRCICGRTGCLHHHLRRRDATPEHVRKALPRLLAAMRVRTLGIEWPSDDTTLARTCHTAGVTDLHRLTPDDAAHFETRGLALACARDLLAAALARAKPARERRVINHEAFRSTAQASVPQTLSP